MATVKIENKFILGRREVVNENGMTEISELLSLTVPILVAPFCLGYN
jgi:hypothetical protein